MHFYMPNFVELAIFVRNRLKIGSCCVLCNRPGRENRDICSACDKWLVPRIIKPNCNSCRFLCLLCGSEELKVQVDGRVNFDLNIKSNTDNDLYCRNCQNTDAVFHRIIAPYRYEYPLDQIIVRMKYGRRRVFGRVLGNLLASAVQSSDLLPDVLIPVPLHPNRQYARGYNQAADIAHWCASELNISCKPQLASRVIDTGSLAGLSNAARQLRILGAFSASPDVRGLQIAIVDDVMTTGATARELARELYDTGALSVELWVLARTSKDR